VEKVIKVIANDDFSLTLKFSTGEVRRFDAHPYLEKGMFTALKDIGKFKQAYVGFDTVCWPGGLDISPETLYDRSVPAGAEVLQAAESRPPYKK
jgi:hypothetical protein